MRGETERVEQRGGQQRKKKKKKVISSLSLFLLLPLISRALRPRCGGDEEYAAVSPAESAEKERKHRASWLLVIGRAWDRPFFLLFGEWRRAKAFFFLFDPPPFDEFRVVLLDTPCVALRGPLCRRSRGGRRPVCRGQLRDAQGGTEQQGRRRSWRSKRQWDVNDAHASRRQRRLLREVPQPPPSPLPGQEHGQVQRERRSGGAGGAVGAKREGRNRREGFLDSVEQNRPTPLSPSPPPRPLPASKQHQVDQPAQARPSPGLPLRHRRR